MTSDGAGRNVVVVEGGGLGQGAILSNQIDETGY